MDICIHTYKDINIIVLKTVPDASLEALLEELRDKTP